MARPRGPRPSDYLKTLKEVAGQQVGHFVGKNLSQLAAINTFSSMMDTRFLSALKLLGPAVASASGQSAFKVFQEKTGYFKELDGTNAGEAMEAVFTGFFMNLGKYGPNPTDEQAHIAFREASASAFSKYANPNLPTVNVANGVINDRMLQAMIDQWGNEQALQVLDLYGVGITALTFAALDPSVPARIAVEAAMAFNHGDFSDVAKMLAFAKQVKANQASVERMVLACAGVVQASTKADHQALRAKFQAERLGGRVLSWVGVNMNEQNVLNVLANWIAPGLVKDAQLSGLLLALWLVIYVVTFIPAMYFASRGMIAPMWAFVVINLLDNLLMLDLLSKVMGAHAFVAAAARKALGGEPETPPYPDILPGKWHLVLRFRLQALLPGMIMGTVVSLLHFAIGYQPYMFLWVFSFMMVGITTSFLIVVRERAISEWSKFWLAGGVRFLIPSFGTSVLIDLIWNYKQGNLLPKGMWVVGGLHDQLAKIQGVSELGFFSAVAVLLTVTAFGAALFFFKEGSGGMGLVAVALCLCLAGIGDCSMGAPERRARADQRAQDRLAERSAMVEMAHMQQARAAAAQRSRASEAQRAHQTGARSQRLVTLPKRPSGQRLVTLPSRGQTTSRNASGQRVRSRASGRNRAPEPAVTGYSDVYTLRCGSGPYRRTDSTRASRPTRFRVAPRERVEVVLDGEILPVWSRRASHATQCYGQAYLTDSRGQVARSDASRVTIRRYTHEGVPIGRRSTTIYDGGVYPCNDHNCG